MTRGKFLHNHVLLAPMAALLTEFGAGLCFEYPVRRDGRTRGYIDLLAIVDDRRVAVEAECSIQRIVNDIRKAEVAGVDLLVIVMPNSNLARRAGNILKAQVATEDRYKSFETWILPLGLALKGLSAWI